MKLQDLTGRKFGRLLVVTRAERLPKAGRVLWHCICDCGQEPTVTGSNLITGNSQSCGCLHSEKAVQRGRDSKTHGHWINGKASPTYRSWLAMHGRCKHPATNGFEYYGGRGIIVCARWASFEHFLTDMGERPAGRSLDRIDGDGNYTPDNCRWATEREQKLNRKIRK